ncbi:type II secretion system F family protein [Advenella sp. RU8]|uniref:type II secretion system F family protein n=1 Tax=Advenella sp. RU8 TaxID=3399575 RepID=UPI003AB0C605
MSWFVLMWVGIAAAILFWFILKWAMAAFRKYEHDFKHLTQKSMSDFFLFFDPVQLWTVAVLMGLLAVMLLWFLSDSLPVALLAGLLVLLAPRHVLSVLKQRRLNLFDRQLPDMLLSLSGALQAGTGVQNALKLLVDEAPSPLSQEIGLMQREQRLGLSFEQALDNLAQRMPSEATGLVVSVLKIATQSGGNLSEALDRISLTLRSRIQIQGRIKVLTSQGKMQAWVMSSLPVGLMLVLNLIDPDSMRFLWGTPIGWAVLAIIVVLEVAGAWMIRKIVSIDI